MASERNDPAIHPALKTHLKCYKDWCVQGPLNIQLLRDDYGKEYVAYLDCHHVVAKEFSLEFAFDKFQCGIPRPFATGEDGADDEGDGISCAEDNEQEDLMESNEDPGPRIGDLSYKDDKETRQLKQVAAAEALNKARDRLAPLKLWLAQRKETVRIATRLTAESSEAPEVSQSQGDNKEEEEQNISIRQARSSDLAYGACLVLSYNKNRNAFVDYFTPEATTFPVSCWKGPGTSALSQCEHSEVLNHDNTTVESSSGIIKSEMR